MIDVISFTPFQIYLHLCDHPLSDVDAEQQIDQGTSTGSNFDDYVRINSFLISLV